MASSPSSRRYDSNRIRRFRKRAFLRQDGRCYYCQQPMFDGGDLLAFAARHRLTRKQALQFKSTAEHLVARQDGGLDSESNIAAACQRCNLARHRRLRPVSAAEFSVYVRKRLLWHGLPAKLPADPHTGSGGTMHTPHRFHPAR